MEALGLCVVSLLSSLYPVLRHDRSRRPGPAAAADVVAAVEDEEEEEGEGGAAVGEGGWRRRWSPCSGGRSVRGTGRPR